MSSSEPSLDRKTLLSLLDASQSLIRQPELNAVLQHVAKEAAEVLNAEGASVLLLDEHRRQFVFRAATGPKGAELVGERFDATLGIAGEAMRINRTICVDDVTQNPHFFEGVDAKTKMRTRSLVASPLKGVDSIMGVIEVLNPRGRPGFSDSDLELLELFSNLAAAALHIAQSYDRVSRDNLGLRKAMPAPQIIGQSAAVRDALELCRRAAPTNTTVLLTGETGTGKELFARAIHDFSSRRDKPFIAVNCAALPEALLESELFGHEKGAFTGAAARKLGRFELADTGTLLLDELAEMSPSIQVKLLRVLQEQEFVRVGGTKTITTNVRVVASTNRDLKKEMEAERFRSELYYRLNVFPIHLPALRERVDDLPLLVDHFVNQIVPNLGIKPPRIHEDAMAAMARYDWPGNIRELRNIVERCALLATDGWITAKLLPSEFAEGVDAAAPDDTEQPARGSKLETQERILIVKALREAGWNQSAAARNLGVSRDHLRYRMKKYELQRP
jgi:transcriptional regulator with GAF, ATPase, and Fis domain